MVFEEGYEGSAGGDGGVVEGVWCKAFAVAVDASDVEFSGLGFC